MSLRNIDRLPPFISTELPGWALTPDSRELRELHELLETFTGDDYIAHFDARYRAHPQKRNDLPPAGVTTADGDVWLRKYDFVLPESAVIALLIPQQARDGRLRRLCLVLHKSDSGELAGYSLQHFFRNFV